MDDKEAQSQLGRQANRAYTPRQRRTLTRDEKVKEVAWKKGRETAIQNRATSNASLPIFSGREK